jgi:hypothetical protein
MAFQFDSHFQQPIAQQPRPKERIGKFSLLVMSAFGLLVIALFAWKPVADAANAALARRNAKEAHAAIEMQDWSRAYEALKLARQRAPQDVEVITAMVAFLEATGSDAGGLAQQLKQLAQLRTLTEEEELLLGRSLIASGKTLDARAVYEKLPLLQSTRQPGLELLSSILSAEGHTKEAAEISRRAAVQTTATSQTHLQAAAADLDSHFGEVKNQALKQLRQMAALSNPTGLDAIAQLAAHPSLTLPQANRLLVLTEQHPHQTLTARLQVISALMRLQPELRNPLADAEVQRFTKSKNGRREEIAYWLMRENLNDQVFALVPKDLAIQSRELYPILMQALAQAKHWEQLQELLKLQRPPVPKSLLDLAMAEVQSHLQPDMRETRRLLQGTVENAVKAGDGVTLQTAAQLAEKLDFADIACLAYKAAGFQTSAGEAALQNLQKSEELALRAKDTRTLLEVSRRLHEMSPSSAVFADRFMYLRLILGVEMETVDVTEWVNPHDSNAAFSIALERIPSQLLLALSAYRLGDHAAMQQHLAALKNAGGLSAGPRAVAAGLLSLGGKPDRAFQMAEKIHGTLLLDEEMAFLKRAL